MLELVPPNIPFGNNLNEKNKVGGKDMFRTLSNIYDQSLFKNKKMCYYFHK